MTAFARPGEGTAVPSTSSTYLHLAFAAVGPTELERAAGCCTSARSEVETTPARRELPLRRLAVSADGEDRPNASCC
jgi:hypothetical protein